MKTICLFAGYDKKGIIDDYVIYYIKSLAKFSDIYYCGDFEPQDKELDKLKPYVKDSIAFRHKKYDYGSWYELIKKIGWNNIQEYDQLMLVNDSCYGPLFPLEEVFKYMENSNCDFWGLSCGKGFHIHIQSYFLVFRKNVLKSNYIPDFLSQVKVQNSLKEVCELYEDQFTFFLKKNGFVYDSYIPYGEFKLHPYYETWNCIKYKRFPLLKVKVFNGEVGFDKVKSWENFIKKNTFYNPKLILNNLIHRGYSKKDIELAIKHFDEKNCFLNFSKNIIKIPKKALKKLISPFWNKYISRFDKRFIENRYVTEIYFKDIKKQINNIEKRINYINANNYSKKANLELQDFFKKYNLINENQLNLKVNKKIISSKKTNCFISKENIIDSLHIDNFMTNIKCIPIFQKNENINILLCGDVNENMIMKYILRNGIVTLLNNDEINNDTIEYKIIENSIYKVDLMTDFCFYKNKNKYFFDLIIINEFEEDVTEGNILNLLYNISKNMLDESILIISIPHKANIGKKIFDILEEVDLYWNHDYQESLEMNFFNIENSDCLVLMKK